MPACPGRHTGHAASDDASGLPVARAAAFPATANLPLQASTDREAYAEVAPPAPNGAAPQMSAKNKPRNKKGAPEREEVPPGKYPLPDNPKEFVQEIHRKIDISEVWHELLRSKDEKVKQRAAERLTAMLYDDGSISAEEPQQIVMDIDSAVARRAAEGARK